MRSAILVCAFTSKVKARARVVMNNRIFLILVLVLSCAILLVGGALVGAALYLQGNPVTADFAPQNTPSAVNALQAGQVTKGSPAPDFTATALDNTIVKLSDFRGKPVMINFWASWCGPCTAEMKNIEAVYQQHANDDFVILALNQGEGNDTIKGYGELWKLNFRLLRDDGYQAGNLYNIKALPTTIFVDKQGIVREIHLGGPMSQEFIEKRVQEMLAE